MQAIKFAMIPSAVAALAFAACGASDKADVWDASPTAGGGFTATEVATRAAVATPSPLPTSTPAPSTPTPEPETLNLLEQGFLQSGEAPDVAVTWYAIVENQSDRFADFVEIKALLFDDAGILLDTSSEYSYFWGRQTGVLTGSTSISRTATRMEIRIGEPRNRNTLQTLEFPTISNVEVVRDRYYGSIRGQVQSVWDKDVEDLEVICLGRDSSGTVVVAESDYLELLPTGAAAVAECSFISDTDLAKLDTAEMFVMWISITK